MIGCLVLLIALFVDYGVQRFLRLVQSHSVVSFPVHQQVIAAGAIAMGDGERTYMRAIQSKLPAGSTIWAWLDAPFQLDFGRNRIWHFNHDWFVAPWRPDVRNAEELRKELLAHNVDYILWRYKSAFAPALPFLRSQLQNPEWVEYRIIHQNTLNLLLALQALANPFDTVYVDGDTVLIALRPRS
jgi:hypothetical protein